MIPGTPMILSERGELAIRDWEKLSLVPYKDAAGLWTIGWGHLLMPGEPRVPITRAEADEIFRLDCLRFVDGVNELIDIPLKQSQFDALVSFAFNVGLDLDNDGVAEGLGDSTLRRLVNGAQHDRAALEFLVWNRAGGRRLNGLLARRAAEALIYSRGDYGQA